MKVILRSDVTNVGKKGDVVEVTDGFGRNYLVPRGLALRATSGALAQAETMRAARERTAAREREQAEAVAARLRGQAIQVPARAGADGRLFGSVTSADIAAAVATQAGVELDRRKLHLEEPIRALGVHQVAVRLEADLEIEIPVEVTPLR